MHILDQYKNQIQKLCENHNVKFLYAFGSVLTEKFNQKSDIDLVIEFKDINVEEYADNYFNFKFSLQSLLNARIDLLEDKAITNPYFRKALNQSRTLIYG
ncbi:MAG: nucleotidyltransferase domain-containing protein [Bacteroidota bacterium]|nr:nucleotidyltransferase domain-containing protein [Bacteroidota bacterium]